MNKLSLKLLYLLIALLFICVIAVPVFGVYFGGFDSPSVFSDDAVNKSMQFGGGTSLYLNYGAAHSSLATEENLNNTVSILNARFQGIGFYDTTVSRTDDKLIRVDVASDSYLDNLVSSLCCKGDWKITGSSSETLLNAAMVEEISMGSDPNTGASAFVFKMTDDGAVRFKANTATYALSSSYVYLVLDGGQYLGMGSVPQNIGNTFSVPIIYSNASQYLPILENGTLPSSMEIERTEPIPPQIQGVKLIIVIAVLAVIFLLIIASLVIFGKLFGIFGVMTVAANLAVLVTAMANNSFGLSASTTITITVISMLSAFLCLVAVKPLAKQLISGKNISLKPIHKVTCHAIWIHTAILAVAVILLFTLPASPFNTIVSIMLLASVSNLICYLVFTYIPVLLTKALGNK